jgi:membrane associated rhomboid family serine protease
MITRNPLFRINSKPFDPLNKGVVNLIWANVLVFALLGILKLTPLGNWVFHFLCFKPTTPLYFSFYSIVTSIFVHDGIWHLLGNMLWLYFMGIILEDLIGKKHLYRLFIGGGISGVLLYYTISSLFSQTNPLVGASAGISAILIATAIFTPFYRVFLFGVVEVEIRWIVLVKVILDLVGIFGSTNAGGYQAHIGGYLFGLLYITELKGIWNLPKIPLFLKNTKPQRKAKVHIHTHEHPNQEEIDRILDKISQGGYDSLTSKEKETLFKASNK